MKRFIFIFAVLLIFFGGTVALANTYETILEEEGYDVKGGSYLSKPQLAEILSIVFKADITPDEDKYSHATGGDFFSLVEGELGYNTVNIPDKEAYKTRALTFESLCDLLDCYFSKLSLMHNLESFYGKLSRDKNGYLLTYGNGQVEEFTEFEYFRVTESLTDVNVILKNGKIIDVCLIDHSGTISRLEEKFEVAGKVYLLFDKGIIIESEGELYEFPITSSFRFINEKDNQEVVLILGSYKKNKNMACIAIGRT